jgi:mono/diheme cytochrome c family protein
MRRPGTAVCRWGILIGAGLLALVAGAAGGQAQTYRERGAYLVTTLSACSNCHTPHDTQNRPIAGMEFAGGREFDLPVGHIVGPNITPDKDTGIGAWSDGQVIFALRNGKRPDGSMIGPPMPIEMYRGLSDRDAEAIAIYLRSLPPIRHEVARSQYKIPPPASYGPVIGHVEEPDRTDKVAYGAYLAGPVAHCIECHTPRVKGKLDLDRIGAGGREFPDFTHPGALTVSGNITPDGIGQWSDADVKRAILVGERPDGAKLAATMPFAAYNGMTSDDVNAIVDYLRTLKPASP